MYNQEPGYHPPQFRPDQRHVAARAVSSTHAWIWAIVTLGCLFPWALSVSGGARSSAAVFWINRQLDSYAEDDAAYDHALKACERLAPAGEEAGRGR